MVTLCVRLVSDRRQTHQATEACPHRAPPQKRSAGPVSTQLAIHTHPIDSVRGPFHKVTSCNWLRMGKSVEKLTNPSKLTKQVCEGRVQGWQSSVKSNHRRVNPSRALPRLQIHSPTEATREEVIVFFAQKEAFATQIAVSPALPSKGDSPSNGDSQRVRTELAPSLCLIDPQA